MIKLIIFDLDGVLTESKDLHFDALNKALIFYNETPISHEEHISKYDGNPTLTKLRLKGITDSEKSNVINYKKQEITGELLEKKIQRDEKFINIFKRLKEEGYIINVASNP